MNDNGPRQSGWVFARIALSLIIAFVLGNRWHQGLLTWPLILMSALIMGLLLLEIFTADRRREQLDFHPDGRPVPRRRATDYQPGVDTAVAPEDGVRTSPGGH